MKKSFGPAAALDSLIEGCSKNDRRSQMTLYKLFAEKMYHTSRRIVKDSLMAEDIVQESFLSAFRSIDSFRREVPFEAWLRRIVVNRSLDYLRNRYNFTEELKEEQAGSAFIENEQDEWPEMREKQLKQIKDAVLGLPEGYRVIFSLYYYEGYDHDEIAGILDISASTSRSQLTRAKQKVIDTITGE